MQRRVPLLITVLFLSGLASWGWVRAQNACEPVGCTYVPLIRAEIHPTDPPTLTPVPSATPIAPILHVRSYRMFPDSIGNLIVAGEIENGTNKPVETVKVIAKFYDGAGSFVATDDTYAIFSRTDPGQRTPFRLYLSNAPAGIARVDLTLNVSAAFLSYHYAAVLSQQSRDNFGVEVFGEVQNGEAKTLRNVQAVVTFYDGAGNVYDVDNSYVAVNDVPPGGTSTYQISTFNTQLTGLAYTVQAQGYFPP